MAFPQQVNIDEQGNLAPGTVTLYTAPSGYNAIIQGITFTSAAANVLTVIVNKLNPISSVTSYAFTLAAGDVVCDNTVYYLKTGESISVTTTAASTDYMFRGLANFTY